MATVCHFVRGVFVYDSLGIIFEPLSNENVEYNDNFMIILTTFIKYILNACGYWYLILNFEIKLMKGKALRKHSLHEKTAASVLLKLFISGNE